MNADGTFPFTSVKGMTKPTSGNCAPLFARADALDTHSPSRHSVDGIVLLLCLFLWGKLNSLVGSFSDFGVSSKFETHPVNSTRKTTSLGRHVDEVYGFFLLCFGAY